MFEEIINTKLEPETVEVSKKGNNRGTKDGEVDRVKGSEKREGRVSNYSNY